MLAHPRAVCRKHELMQYDLETAAQDLASKKQQCEELATGVSVAQGSAAAEARVQLWWAGGSWRELQNFLIAFFFPGMVYYRLQNNCIGYNVLASLVFLFQGVCVCVCCMTVVPAEGWRRHLDPLELLRSWRQLWVTVLLMWVLELNPGLLK